MKEVLIAVVALYPLVGDSASFDCQKTTQLDEMSVCANRTLNDMDVEMATKYQFLQGLFPMGTCEVMQDEQKKWLRSRLVSKVSFVISSLLISASGSHCIGSLASE
ncbi:hypothetical protein QDW80_003831 [Salmonella enterica]|nr:hypothetical protein [Salmonella enterica]